MKFNYILMLAGAMFLVSCTSEEESSPSQDFASQIASFKLDDSTAMFRVSEDSESQKGLGALSANSERKKNRVYTILDSGGYRNLRFINHEGIEQEIENVFAYVFKSLSRQYVYIEMTNTFQGLVNIKDGSIIRTESMKLQSESLAIYGDYLFGYSKDGKSLYRINLLTRESQLYVTLGAGLSFRPDGVINTSPISMHWDDTHGLSPNYKGIKTLIADRDLNVLGMVMADHSIYPPWELVSGYYAITPSGEMKKVNIADVQGKDPISLVYTSGRLYSVASLSGQYVPGWIESTSWHEFDYTVSEIRFTMTGVERTEIQQIKPMNQQIFLTGNHHMCRTDYSVDSTKIYTFTFLGVLTIDFSKEDSSILSFQNIRRENYDLWIKRPDFKPSSTCYVAGDYIYSIDYTNTKIYRGDLRNLDSSRELIVEMSNIKSFYVVGKHVFFSADSGTFRMKKDGSELQAMSGSFDINDIINIR